MVTVIIVGLLLAVAVIVWLSYRRMTASDGLTPREREVLSLPEREILSMLRQHGGPLRQDRLIADLYNDTEELAGVILIMEEKGTLKRKWDREAGTYMVSAASVDGTSA